MAKTITQDPLTRAIDSMYRAGNYGGSLSIRVQRCDAIVFFDMPRLTCVDGVLQR